MAQCLSTTKPAIQPATRSPKPPNSTFVWVNVTRRAVSQAIGQENIERHFPESSRQDERSLKFTFFSNSLHPAPSSSATRRLRRSYVTHRFNNDRILNISHRAFLMYGRQKLLKLRKDKHDDPSTGLHAIKALTTFILRSKYRRDSSFSGVRGIHRLRLICRLSKCRRICLHQARTPSVEVFGYLSTQGSSFERLWVQKWTRSGKGSLPQLKPAAGESLTTSGRSLSQLYLRK